MILHKLSISNFKAIENEEIEFGDRGITLIEGRNESGKTSVFEAFSLLINTKSGAKTKTVRESVRTNADEPMTITAEMTIDGARIRYSKTYLSKAKTSLDFLFPVKSALRDTEAHDYVRSKLEDSANLKLWEKLSLRQDEQSTQLASIDEISSLKQALDAEAGETMPAGDDSLFHRVKDERDKYLGGKGQPIGELKKLHDEVAHLQAELDSARSAAATLDNDVEALADIESKLREKRRILDERKTAVGTAEEKATRLAEVERANEEFGQRSQLAQAKLDSAALARDRRREQADSVETQRTTLEALEQSAEETATDTAAAQESLTRAEEDHDAAEAETRKISAELASTRRRIEEIELRRELATRQRRHDKVEELTNRANELSAQKERINADTGYVEKLRRAQSAMREADATLKAGSSLVSLAGKGEAVIDGDAISVAGGWSAYAENPIHLGIGEVTVSIVPPRNAAEAKEKYEEARKSFAAQLAERGYDSVYSAETDLKSLAELDNAIAETKGQRESALGEDTAEDNRQRIEALKVLLAEREDGIDSSAEDLVDDNEAILAESKERVTHIERDLETANNALAAARGLVNQTRIREVEARGKAVSVRETLIDLREAYDRATASLQTARTETPDDALESAFAVAEKAVEKLVGEGEDIASKLADARRDATLNSLENARQALKRHQTENEDLIRRRTELESRIQIRSEQGLATRKDEAEIELRQTQQRCESMQARADAADLLLTTLEAHRQQLISRYSAPLRSKLVHYGRLVFGKDFDVSLDEHLVVAERKLDGTTVSFDQLSGGAKEQFALLTRLVCAELVGEATVPIFLDDTMGFTDPLRRQAMAAVLTEAGKESQIIVLTCDESRFDAIGEATQHSMS